MKGYQDKKLLSINNKGMVINMKIKFVGQLEDVYTGVRIFEETLGYEIADDGLCVEIQKNYDNKLIVSGKQNQYIISYHKKADFFRCLAILMRYLREKTETFFVCQQRSLDAVGVWLDLSRGAVMNIATLKDFVKRMALMGLDSLYLYMEDIYQLKDYPYFGYMRGAYSEEELEEIDEFADSLGVEAIPAIQTLGHMEKTFRWRYTGDVQDNDSTLLVGAPETYSFIDKMLETISRCFRTRRINVGMDEAYGIGRGEYLSRNGYEDPYAIMSKHMDKIIELAQKYQLEPTMFSDMFFTLGSDGGTQYDAQCRLPENVSQMIPEGIKLMYWDYFIESEEKYDLMFRLHKQLNREIEFAGGVCSWGNVVGNHGKTFRTSTAALRACKKNGIKTVVLTMWGDDGRETSYYQALPIMQLYAEYCYADDVSAQQLSTMFETCTGYNIESFRVFDVDDYGNEEAMKRIDDIWQPVMVSKQVFYQDILLGLFDENYKDIDLEKRYADILCMFDTISIPSDLSYLFTYQRKLLEILQKKSKLSLKIYNAYHGQQADALRKLSADVGELKQQIGELCELFEKLWLKENKAFGLETIDLRFGGIAARLNYAQKRINSYLAGEISQIEELETERLIYNNLVVNHNEKLVYEDRFQRIATVQII